MGSNPAYIFSGPMGNSSPEAEQKEAPMSAAGSIFRGETACFTYVLIYYNILTAVCTF
jgi:hypothetical protein